MNDLNQTIEVLKKVSIFILILCLVASVGGLNNALIVFCSVLIILSLRALTIYFKLVFKL